MNNLITKLNAVKPRRRGNTSIACRRQRHSQPVSLLLAAGVGVSCLLGGLSSVRAQSPGSLDTSFDPGSGTDDTVYSVAIQPDNKVVIGGNFNHVNGVTRGHIARLNPDGSLDTSFAANAGANYAVLSVAIQADGKVLIGGNFYQVSGVLRFEIARLNPDGSLDTDFDPGTSRTYNVHSVVPQADGKVLVGDAYGIVRRNADGSVDTGFALGSANDIVFSIARQADGKVLVGGRFTQFDGVAHSKIARVNADGSVDTGFNPGTGANSDITSIAVQADGKVLVGGDFTQFNGVPRNYVARLNPDGSLDTSFDPGTGANNVLESLAVEPDGMVLIGGVFSQVDSVTRNYIARLNSDGSLDTTFDSGSGPNNFVFPVVLQGDGKVVIGGYFTQVNGVSRNHIARLNGNVAAPMVASLGSITKTGSNVLLQGVGVPSAVYHIQVTTDLLQPFDPNAIGTATADSSGNFQFTDTTNLARRFYRAVYP